MERADIAIIGTGPAGVSAAITAKVRGKTVLLFGSRELSSKLTKAHKIQNYPGLPDIDGAQLAQAFKKHLDVLEIPITEKQVTAVYAMGGCFGIQTPDAMLEASSVILAGGVVMGKTFPKEDELLGRGVTVQPAMRIFTPEKPLQSWDTTQNPAGKRTFWQKLRAGCCISLLCPTRLL